MNEAVELSPAARLLAALLEARTGQQIGAGRVYRIEAALKPLLKAKGLASLDALTGELARGPDGSLSCDVVDALLNGETSFFRDAPVHELVADAIEAARARAPLGRPRLWSAGCSTGQEPLSLAMLLAERMEGRDVPFPEIVATDVSGAAIARARTASFSQFEVQRGLPVRRMIQWFMPVADAWVARPELIARIAFRKHNLIADPPPAGRFDVILCRNVLLYFSQERRREAFVRIASALRPGGLLVMGAGETVIGQTERLVPSPHQRGTYVLVDPTPVGRVANARG